MAIYRIDGIDNKQAQKIGESIDALGKDFKPHDVVAAARDTRSPLNGFFQWDDSKAAAEYRLSQARSLIQRVRIVIQTKAGEKIETRAFHNVEIVVANKLVPRYVPLRTVKANNNLAKQVIQEALRELREWNRKYRDYSNILGTEIFEVITETLDELKELYGRPA
jgi:hypothetical protein